MANIKDQETFFSFRIFSPFLSYKQILLPRAETLAAVSKNFRTWASWSSGQYLRVEIQGPQEMSPFLMVKAVDWVLQPPSIEILSLSRLTFNLSSPGRLELGSWMVYWPSCMYTLTVWWTPIRMNSSTVVLKTFKFIKYYTPTNMLQQFYFLLTDQLPPPPPTSIYYTPLACQRNQVSRWGSLGASYGQLVLRQFCCYFDYPFLVIKLLPDNQLVINYQQNTSLLFTFFSVSCASVTPVATFGFVIVLLMLAKVKLYSHRFYLLSSSLSYSQARFESLKIRKFKFFLISFRLSRIFLHCYSLPLFCFFFWSQHHLYTCDWDRPVISAILVIFSFVQFISPSNYCLSSLICAVLFLFLFLTPFSSLQLASFSSLHSSIMLLSSSELMPDMLMFSSSMASSLGWAGELCLVSVPSSCENRSFLMGEGDSRYSGCFRMGVYAWNRPGEKVSRKGHSRSLLSASSIMRLRYDRDVYLLGVYFQSCLIQIITNIFKYYHSSHAIITVLYQSSSLSSGLLAMYSLVMAQMTPKAQLVSTQWMQFINLMVIFCRWISSFSSPLLSGCYYRYRWNRLTRLMMVTDRPQLQMYLSMRRHRSNKQYSRISIVLLRSFT